MVPEEQDIGVAQESTLDFDNADAKSKPVRKSHAIEAASQITQRMLMR